MRIGITCYPTYGGSGVVATELGKELAIRGHEVHFVSYALPFRLNLESPRTYFHEVEVTSYPLFDYKPYTLALASQMLQVAMEEKLDVLHVHYAIPHSVSAYLAKQMMRPHKLPIITTLHGTDISLVGTDRSYLPITKFSIEQSDGVTSISESLRTRTVREFGVTHPIELIYNFVNCSQFVKRSSDGLRDRFASKGEKILIHISNFRAVKRVCDVVEIFNQVQKTLPSRLLMVGDGPERAQAEYHAELRNIRDRVYFVGKQEAINEYLGISDLLLLPSDDESFGLVALEAMACEVPVIASKVGGLPEVVRDGVDGYLIPPRNVAEMSQRAIEILSDPKLQELLGKHGRERAEANFCTSIVIPKYLEYYDRIIAQVGK
ncbi:MAG: N-acetyl-alpha-D-glucosaminyl L-malate synthase BshA [Acidobacteriia bacterium]|nr:N-acetyl-alpha-D-glucosaminyl L-malate synthase BshA [Terriglobia bacterium]